MDEETVLAVASIALCLVLVFALFVAWMVL